MSKKIKSSSTAVEPDDDSDGDGADGNGSDDSDGGESIEEGTTATPSDKLDAMGIGGLKIVLGAMGFSEKGTRKVLLSRLHNKIDKGTHPARPAHPARRAQPLVCVRTGKMNTKINDATGGKLTRALTAMDEETGGRLPAKRKRLCEALAVDASLSPQKKQAHAYNMFVRATMPSVKADNVGLSNAEVMKEIGRRWVKSDQHLWKQRAAGNDQLLASFPNEHSVEKEGEEEGEKEEGEEEEGEEEDDDF